MKARTRIVIRGLVQGVLFRREITNVARSAGITGWVRNLPDGRVEAIAEGEKEKLEELIRFCYIGPPRAKVSGVEVDWSDFKGEFRGFRIVQ